MKKFLLLSAMLLALFMSMTAGTMATYTQTVGTSAAVKTKSFGISANRPQEFTEQISIEPGYKEGYVLKIQNVGETRVRMKVSAEIKITDGKGPIEGLTVKVGAYYNGWTYGDVGNYSQIEGYHVLNSALASDDWAKSCEYKIYLEWDEELGTVEDAGRSFVLDINAVGTQTEEKPRTHPSN